MIQRTLFDAPVARRADPQTSHIAAKEIDAKLNRSQVAVEMMIDRSARPHTAQELASECSKLFGGMADTYRKRAHELVAKNRAVECEPRRCEITGKMATTYGKATP